MTFEELCTRLVSEGIEIVIEGEELRITIKPHEVAKLHVAQRLLREYRTVK